MSTHTEGMMDKKNKVAEYAAALVEQLGPTWAVCGTGGANWASYAYIHDTTERGMALSLSVHNGRLKIEASSESDPAWEGLHLPDVLAPRYRTMELNRKPGADVVRRVRANVIAPLKERLPGVRLLMEPEVNAALYAYVLKIEGR